MPERQQCEFLVVRYAPDAVKDEYVNIGVVLLNHGAGTADVQFTQDWRRVRCLDPDADVPMLQAMEAELRQRLRAGVTDRQRVLHLLRDSFSNAVQVSLPRGVLTEFPEEELDRLLEMYTGRVARGRARDYAGRTAIVACMRDAFTQAGVWRIMPRNISVAKYTHPGDPLKLDCGYRPNGVLKFFHAVPMLAGAEAAKALAFSYPMIREGIARIEGAGTELTAIVEDNLSTENDETAFALATLADGHIQIAAVAQLPDLAQTARRELRV